MTDNTRLDRLLEARAGGTPKRMAVAAAEGAEVLAAVCEAAERGIVAPVLVGDEGRIRQIGQEDGLHLERCEIVHAAGHQAAAREAVRMVRDGEVQVLMKGVLVSSILMREILNKETGIRVSNTLSIVSAIDSPLVDRLILLSDGGMVMYPTLQQKIDIIHNAAGVARKLGVAEPKVACLAALELVNPDMPPTMDAAALSVMSQRGQLGGCVVDGPYQLDNAISAEAVREKGLRSPSTVAGHADILLMPNIETGNAVLKALRYMGGCGIAGLMAGAAAPVVMSSRADTVVNKLRSIALALAAAG